MLKRFTLILSLFFSALITNAQILTENFEEAWSPNPSGWYQEELDGGSGSGTNQWWQQATYSSGNWSPTGSGEPNSSINGLNAAFYNNYDATEGQIDRLSTYDIDLSSTQNPYVTFYLWYRAGTIDFKLVASNDGGNNWNDVSSSIEATDQYWKKFTYFLPEIYKVANARIGFQITTASSMYDIWLDSVIVADAPPALTGTKTIDNTLPTAGDNFNSFTDAFNYLNTSGVGTGGVIFNVTEGQSFEDNLPVLTVTGTSDKQITFKNSATPGINNPTIKPEGTGSNDFAVKLHETSYVTFNGIDIDDKSTNFNYDLQIETGYILENNSSHNTIKNCKIDLKKANTNYSIGIKTANGGNDFNSFINNEITDCTGAYFFGDVSSVEYDEGNVISTEAGGQSLISNIGNNSYATKYFVQIQYQKDFILSNTQMSGISVNQSPIYGIYVKDGYNTTCQIFNNTISGIEKTGTTRRYVAAIKISYGNHNIYGNEITDIENTSGSAVGIDISSYGDNNIYQNKIHNIRYTDDANDFAGGIFVDISSSKVANIYNNLIYDLQAIDAATNVDYPVNSAGIYVDAGTANIYYNTICLNYTSNNSSNISSGLYLRNHYSGFDVRNNIIVNKVSGTYSKAVAFFHSSTDYSEISNASNNNLYFAGTPSANNLIFYNGTNGFETIDAFKSEVISFDQLSITEDVNFLSSVSPFDLHINTTIPTAIESGAFPISSPITINADYENNTRNISTPDIGAFEGDYTILDIIPPSISYDNIRTTNSTANYILNDYFTIVDASGVDVTTNKPRLYYKNRDDNDAFVGNTNADNGWKFVEITNASSPFSFTIDFNLLYGSSANEGDIIDYFIVAQDLATSPNVTANPNDGFVATSVSNISSAPSNPNFFFISNIYYDFEAPDDERFTHDHEYGFTIDEWERGTPSGGDFYPTSVPSGTKCWGTKLDANYTGTSSYYLKSPVFLTTDDLIIIDFSDFLYADPVIIRSLVSLEYRFNNGIWYSATGEYTRQDTEWSNQVLTINGAAGYRLEFRWLMTNDYADTYAGWFIDDFYIRGVQHGYNVTFTVVDEDSEPISYPHVWIDGATGNDYWLGEVDGTRTVILPNGNHSYRVNGPHECYDYATGNFTVTDADLEIPITLYNCVGVDNVNSSDFKIYPNPANEHFYIEGLNVNEKYNLQIINILGQVVYNKLITNSEKEDINIFNLKSGIYNLSLKTNNNIISFNIIVQ